MGLRHRGRELAFQILFQMDLTGDRVNAVIARFEGLKHVNQEAKDFAEALARGAAEGLEANDALIRSAAEHWKLERLLSVDRALLRLGAYELAGTPGTPAEVVLNECIELAKDYGSDESPAFVNGVLDRLSKQLRTASPAKAAGPAKAKKRRPKAGKA